jgi:ribosomal protein S12 methylthiotransferase
MKIGLLSLGCPKNLVDSEVMLGLATAAGHELTPHAAEADVLIVNTCAFVDEAKQESIDAILEMADHKKRGACSRLVVTGCLAERYRDELQAQIPEIDAVLGTGDVPSILRAITGTPAGPAADVALPLLRKNGDRLLPGRARIAARHRAAVPGRTLPTYIYDAETPRLLTTPRHYAYVKIAEGCDYNCAFCIIPALRGQYRSRPRASIVDEARALAARGVRELLLISQDTTFYGVDRRERGALASLLRELNSVDGIEWIRLLYLYPTTVTPDVLEAMAECEKICKYVDLPLQHTAASMLRRMRRPGSRSSYEQLLTSIRQRVPGVTLRTTFIVGFPGETAEEFADLCDFVETVRFDHLGVFTYSHEEGTAAGDELEDDVPASVKRRRRGALMARQRRIVARRNAARVGERTRVVVDGPSPQHELVLQARLEGQAPDIDPVVYLTNCDPAALAPGQFLAVEIVEARDYDLIARPLAHPHQLC